MVAGAFHPVMPKPYMATCDDCPFERATATRAKAAAVARRHLDETGHDVLAVEMPRPR